LRQWLSAWAEFSPCGLYRYRLGRRWYLTGPTWAFIMLNPSKAGADRDDPTILSCARIAQAAGAAAIEVANLHAFISTDPGGLRQAADPYGPLNTLALAITMVRADVLVAAWGNIAPERAGDIKSMAGTAGKPLYCLRKTKGGHPHHPLRLPTELTLQVYA
jgi:hypothetical protein